MMIVSGIHCEASGGEWRNTEGNRSIERSKSSSKAPIQAGDNELHKGKNKQGGKEFFYFSSLSLRS